MCLVSCPPFSHAVAILMLVLPNDWVIWIYWWQHQTGAMPGSEIFSIQRGVRQRNVLSSLLFNAVLEHAMRKWKLKLTNEGLRLGQDTRLTNLRYADDLMIFATSREELVFMVETLAQELFFWLCTCMPWCGSPFRAQELSLIGLQLSGTKTKVLMTSTLQGASHVEICGTMVAILHGEMTHKYLGRKFPSNLNSRTEVELMYRIQCAWSKFHQHKLILLNKHVTLRLRLKLFHATVSSTAMFGLASLPLTQRFLHKLDVVQRRMLRSIVGWVRIPDEPWENTMRRMNQRMEHVAYLHPLPSWSNQYFTSQYRLATKIVSNQFSWVATAVAWMPLADWVHNFPSAPSRSRGRPPKRWDQAVASFSCTYFGERNWWVAAQNCKQWLAAEAAFVKYCESMWRTKGSPCPFRIEVTRTGEGKNITPTNLFGLMTCPLISNQLPKLEVVRNRMSRSIVGWAPLVDNDWHALRQRMNRYLVTDNKMLSAKRSSERVGVPSAKSSPSLPALLLPTLIPPPTTCQTAMCPWAEEFWCGCESSPRALFGSGHHTLHQRGSTSIRRCLSQISTCGGWATFELWLVTPVAWSSPWLDRKSAINHIAQMVWSHAVRLPWSGLWCGAPFATGSQGFPEAPLDVTMQGLFYQTSTAVFRSSCFFNSLLRRRAPTIIRKTFGEVWRSISKICSLHCGASTGSNWSAH